MALTYKDVSAAEKAAEIVTRRLLTYESISHRAPLTSVFDLHIEPHVYVGSDWDGAVALVTLRHPYPATKQIDMTKHGKLTKTVFESIYWRRFTPLIVDQ